MKKIRARVSGRVQGVWFRASARDKAVELGVRGYVKNLASGDVEFVAAGDEEAVDALIEWASHGPPMARVERVRIEPLASDEDFDGFYIAS